LSVVTLLHAGDIKNRPVVIALAQGGKAGFLKHRTAGITKLLQDGIAVCLPDLCGTGETKSLNDGRGRTSAATSLSATEQMHGHHVAITQFLEIRMLLQELKMRGFGPVAMWGDSFAEPNDPSTNLAVPYDADKLPRQSEPMGSLMALAGSLSEDDLFGMLIWWRKLPTSPVKAIYARGGLVSYRSILDSPFCYFPHDAVFPEILVVGDLSVLVSLNKTRAIRIEARVDGLNRRVDQKAVSSPAEVAAWLSAQLKK
jgi:hypothetical protein